MKCKGPWELCRRSPAQDPPLGFQDPSGRAACKQAGPGRLSQHLHAPSQPLRDTASQLGPELAVQSRKAAEGSPVAKALPFWRKKTTNQVYATKWIFPFLKKQK